MKTQSDLFISSIELPIFLGWSDEERQREQTVYVTLEIHFSISPKACETDQLDDTLCYHKLIDLISEKTRARHFRLVEHLAQTIFQLVEPSLPQQTTLMISVTKQPVIDGFNGVITFRYGNQT